MSSSEHKAKIWNIIKSIKTGMLVTSGQPIGIHARPMQLVQDEYGGKLWFFTDKQAEKTNEINYDNEVCVSFSDPKSNTYVSMTGNAKLIDNEELINKFWNPQIEAWFPNGKDDSNIGLIEIKIDHGEHWDGTTNPIKRYFEQAKAIIKDETPNLGENQKF